MKPCFRWKAGFFIGGIMGGKGLPTKAQMNIGFKIWSWINVVIFLYVFFDNASKYHQSGKDIFYGMLWFWWIVISAYKIQTYGQKNLVIAFKIWSWFMASIGIFAMAVIWKDYYYLLMSHTAIGLIMFVCFLSIFVWMPWVAYKMQTYPKIEAVVLPAKET